MSKKVVIYSKNNCNQCNFAKGYIKSMGVDFEERNINSSEAFNAELMEIADRTGFTAMPFIVVDDQEVISGFIPDKIDEHLA